MPFCTGCGHENPDDARFCAACGAQLAGGPAQPPREARKTVTVVFSDLAGSTSLGERLDPESIRRVMSGYFDAMSAVLLRHGGTVEKFIGDAIVAVFGVPVLHEDDALRAVRAAAEMRERLVTVKPVGMQTSSVAPGSVSPLQLVATFHAPVAGPSHVFVQGETAAGAIALRAPSGAWKPKAAATAPADPLVLGVEPELAANASAATVTSTAILETLDPPQIVVREDFRAADPSLSGWLRRGATASGTSPVLQLRQEKSTEASAV